MKTLLLGVLLIAPIQFTATSCSTDSNDAPVVPAPTLYAQTYIVDFTGVNVTVTQIDYTDGGGNNVVVMNPILPWNVAVSVGAGETARLAVAGTTGAASEITATIQDDPIFWPFPATYATMTCVENTNPCAIDIQHTF
jgi:hypothetical protein